MSTTGQTKRITPALRFHFLTPIYDSVVRYSTREARFKSLVIDTMALTGSETVLDVGCGTGTLLLAIGSRFPSTALIGLDADPEILSIASHKLRMAGIDGNLVHGFSTQMAIEDESVDSVASTLFFHHLSREQKQTTICEIWRVLRPGGSVVVADWGRPTGRIQRLAFYQVQLLDGFETTRGHVFGEPMHLFQDSMFQCAEEFAHVRTVFGTLRLFKATKE